jgi:23S rRNA (cytosine1962-C5)-methyltransferase
MLTATIKPGREKSILRRHPWIFSGAIKDVQGEPAAGATVLVHDVKGNFLAHAAYSPSSQIRLRVWSFEDETIDGDFFQNRLEQALSFRKSLGLMEPGAACRLINAESDGLPGVIVDRYDTFLVVQFLSAGAEYFRDLLVDRLQGLLHPLGIYERSDADVRLKEGLSPRTGLLTGKKPPELLAIREGSFRFLVDIHQGHKTGFYLDQRENRQLLAGLVQGRSALNCFSYSGGFGIAAMLGGAASLINVDSSRSALELARRHAEINSLSKADIEYLEADVFKLLRTFRDSGRSFDCIILDPPKFAESRQQIAGSARGYKDINLLAFKLLRPGGRLFTFSCSGLIDQAFFQKIVADASLDAKREAKIIHRMEQAADHAASLSFPEGWYLKGLICQVE